MPGLHSPRFHRRSVLAGLLGLATLGHGPAKAWYALRDDAGRAVENTRLPVELLAELETMPSVLRIGAAEPEVTIYEFYDFNCPSCRKAAADLKALAQEIPGLAVGLFNNPILSAASRDAAAVEDAVHRTGGRDGAVAFHFAMWGMRGHVTGERALDLAAEMGHDRAALAELARSAEARGDVARRLELAASLGLGVTPTFVAGVAAIAGYPGPRTLAEVVEAVRNCAEPVCR